MVIKNALHSYSVTHFVLCLIGLSAAEPSAYGFTHIREEVGDAELIHHVFHYKGEIEFVNDEETPQNYNGKRYDYKDKYVKQATAQIERAA